MPGRVPLGNSELARLVRSDNGMAGAIEAGTDAERPLAALEHFVGLG